MHLLLMEGHHRKHVTACLRLHWLQHLGTQRLQASGSGHSTTAGSRPRCACCAAEVVKSVTLLPAAAVQHCVADCPAHVALVQVALKALSLKGIKDWKQLELFQREAVVLQVRRCCPPSSWAPSGSLLLLL